MVHCEKLFSQKIFWRFFRVGVKAIRGFCSLLFSMWETFALSCRGGKRLPYTYTSRTHDHTHKSLLSFTLARMLQTEGLAQVMDQHAVVGAQGAWEIQSCICL